MLHQTIVLYSNASSKCWTTLLPISGDELYLQHGRRSMTYFVVITDFCAFILLLSTCFPRASSTLLEIEADSDIQWYCLKLRNGSLKPAKMGLFYKIGIRWKASYFVHSEATGCWIWPFKHARQRLFNRLFQQWHKLQHRRCRRKGGLLISGDRIDGGEVRGDFAPYSSLFPGTRLFRRICNQFWPVTEVGSIYLSPQIILTTNPCILY